MQCVTRITVAPVAFQIGQFDGRRLAGFGFEFRQVFDEKLIVAGEQQLALRISLGQLSHDRAGLASGHLGT